MGRRTKARECALQMLYQWEATQDPMPVVAETFWRVRTTTDETRAMAERLASGTHAHRAAVDEAITAAALNWRFDRIASVDKNILRLGLAELNYFPDIPKKVTIDEAIELAKTYGSADSGRFVNGVLDAMSKEV